MGRKTPRKYSGISQRHKRFYTTCAYVHEKQSLGKCPLCGGSIYEGKVNFYCSNYKAETPCKFTVWKEIAGASITSLDVTAMLAGKKTKLKKCKSSKSGDFQAAFSLSKSGKIEFSFPNNKK